MSRKAHLHTHTFQKKQARRDARLFPEDRNQKLPFKKLYRSKIFYVVNEVVTSCNKYSPNKLSSNQYNNFSSVIPGLTRDPEKIWLLTTSSIQSNLVFTMKQPQVDLH